MQHSHSRHQKTTLNLLRISLKGKLRFNNAWPIEGAVYITMVKFQGHSENVCFMQLSQNMWKQFTRLLELLKLYKQNPLEDFSFYPNYIGFKMSIVIFDKNSLSFPIEILFLLDLTTFWIARNLNGICPPIMAMHSRNINVSSEHCCMTLLKNCFYQQTLKNRNLFSSIKCFCILLETWKALKFHTFNLDLHVSKDWLPSSLVFQWAPW